MQISNCIWELKNLGKKTTEIIVENDDHFIYDRVSDVVKEYEYVVIKVPMNKPDFNIGLSTLGYTCMELQMNLQVTYEMFRWDKVKDFIDDTTFEIVETPESFQSIISNITPGMFSTDRVSIDPLFGMTVGCQRYINWISSEYQKGEATLIRVMYHGNHIGFMLVKIVGDDIQLLLNGLYKPFQRKGLGIITPASPMMYANKTGLTSLCERTSISSNNISVLKLYNKLDFQIESQSYVYVKHIS